LEKHEGETEPRRDGKDKGAWRDNAEPLLPSSATGRRLDPLLVSDNKPSGMFAEITTASDLWGYVIGVARPLQLRLEFYSYSRDAQIIFTSCYNN